LGGKGKKGGEMRGREKGGERKKGEGRVE